MKTKKRVKQIDRDFDDLARQVVENDDDIWNSMGNLAIWVSEEHKLNVINFSISILALLIVVFGIAKGVFLLISLLFVLYVLEVIKNG